MPTVVSQTVRPDLNYSFTNLSQSTFGVSSRLTGNRYMAEGFDPSMVPPDQLIIARTPKPLSGAQWLHHSVKNGFMSLVRQFKMLGILINIYSHNYSVESFEKAAAKSEGGLLIKAIQFVCSSPVILNSLFGDDAEKFLNALSHVSISNKPMSRKELEYCLKQAKVPYDPERLNECTNLGTGSLGDVKEITLLTGERQVVKLISPSSEVRVHSDLKVLRFLLGLVQFFKPDSLGQGTRHAINEFFTSVKDELNLVNEAQNTQKQDFAFQALQNGDHFHLTDRELPACAAGLPDSINEINITNPLGQRINIPVNYKVPRVSQEQLTQRTMCMQKINGATLSDSDSHKLRSIAGQLFQVDPRLINDELLETFRQSMKRLAHNQWTHCYAQTGFFNGDMHDGNVMVAVENGQLSIYFIDLGNGQWVGRDTVKATFTILGAMEMLRDTEDEELRDEYADTIIDNLQSMAEYDPNEADWGTLKTNLKDLMAYGTPGEIPEKVLDTFDLAYPCNIYVPKEIVSLFRAQILIDSQEPQDR